MSVPLIPLFKVFMADDAGDKVKETLASGMITQASKVREFEERLARYLDHPYVLTLNSATSGLTLALRLLNLPVGSEVLCTPLTCLATNFPVLANGLKIKWVDVDQKTCNMSLDDLERKITTETKAVLFVHWGGSPIDMNRMKRICRDIPIIEDCAHAFGARYNREEKVGVTGNIAVFSFQAIKTLTTGDGGMIVLPNKELYERAKKLRWFGLDREKRSLPGKDFRLEEDVPEYGYKFHMNDINATIGLANFEGALFNLKQAGNTATYYNNELKNVKNVTLLTPLPGSFSSYWIYTMRVKNRENFIEFMTDRNVVVSQVHSRNDTHSCLREYSVPLPHLDKLSEEIICLPVGWWVSDSDRERIVSLVKEWSESVE